MKKHIKGIILTIIICIVFIALYIGGVVWANKEQALKDERARVERINTDANRLLNVILDKSITDDLAKNMEQSYYLNLSDRKSVVDFSDKIVGTDNEDIFQNIKFKEGKLLIYSDGTIKVVENIKIEDLYCTYDDKKFECNKKNKKNTNVKKVKEYKEYKIGDNVTLSDGSTWSVIYGSNKYEDTVVLLKDTLVTSVIQNDGSVIDMPLFVFDNTNSNKLNINSEGNIAYYLAVNNKLIVNAEEVKSLRLLEYNEYDRLMDIVTTDYTFDDYALTQPVVKSWLYNHTLADWWIYSESDGYPFLIPNTLGFGSSSYKRHPYRFAKTVYNTSDAHGLRPVAEVSKDSLK